MTPPHRPTADDPDLRADGHPPHPDELLRTVVDALPAHVAILDDRGTIVAVNEAWSERARRALPADASGGVGASYLDVGRAVSGPDLREAKGAAAGIAAVIAGERPDFYLEYECHARSRRQWFQMRATGFESHGRRWTAAVHEDVTDRIRGELALRANEARLRSTLAGTLDPLVTVDDSGTILAASDSLERVLGWKPADVVGRNVKVLVPEPHRSRHDEYLENYRRSGVTTILGRTREFDALHADGHLVPIDISVSRTDIPGHDRPVFTGILRDISERKRADLERRLIQSLTLAIGSARDLETAMALALERICEATGWEYGEAWLPEPDGKALAETPVWHARGDDLDRFEPMTRGPRFSYGEGLPGRVWASRRPEWVDSLTPETIRRAEIARQVGFRAGVAVPILAEDKVVAVAAFFMTQVAEKPHHLTDLVSAAVAPLGPVIQRRRAEAALAESERRLREMLLNVDLLAVTVDGAGRVTFCNDYLLRMTGWARDEVLGGDWFQRFVPEGRAAPDAAAFARIIDGGGPEPHFEGEVLTRSGARRLIAWSVMTLRDPKGARVGMTGLGIDITDQRHNEEELARHREHLERLVAERTAALEASHEQLRLADRLASIGTLVAGLGHDMNNVLLPVRTRLDVLDSIQLAPEARDHLDAIRDSTDYLQQLTDGLHLLALDPDDPEASSGATELGPWWEQAQPLLRKVIPGHARFASEVPSDLPPVAVAPHRLTQAVLNLVVNAGEVIAERGHVTVWARAVPDAEAVQIGVTDDGPGMPPEIRRRALEPFFTTKTRGLGTGLGLSLVHGVAKSAGGAVRIVSESPHGTTVMLTLPVSRAAAARGDIGAEPTRAAAVTLSDARIASLLSTFLRTCRFHVEHARPTAARPVELWIMEPATGTIEQVKRFLAEAPGRRVVVCGPKSADWQKAGAHAIEDAEDFELVRRRIGEVLDPGSEAVER